MDIEFNNLKSICNTREVIYIDYDINKPIYQCKHKERKSVKCEEDVCPINNTNYWIEGESTVLISGNEKFEIGNIKYHITKRD